MKVILITEDHYNALGVIRSIGESGIKSSVIITSKNKSYIEHSKYVEQYIKVKRSEKEIIDAINKIIIDNDRNIIYPLSDFAAMLIDKYHKKFTSNVVVPHMEGNIEKYLNKAFVKEEAKKYGLCVPEGMVINSDEVENVFWDIFPSILKPVLSIEGVKSDIVKVDNIKDMKTQISRLKSKGYKRILVEKYVEGKNEYMVEVMGYCSKDNMPNICGIIEKIREYPIKNGSTAYARIVKKCSGIDEKSIISFLKSTKFYGIFDMEFKYVDGTLYFIECNFRNGAPGYAITLSGKNIPLLWVKEYLEDIEVINNQIIDEMHFMCEQNDIINMLKGDVSFKLWFKEYLKAKKIFFDVKDCKPVLIYYFNIFKSRILSKKRI